MQITQIKDRFRKFLPVVVDVETGGFNPKQHALLEVCAIPLDLNEEGILFQESVWSSAIKPHAKLKVDESAQRFLGFDPYSALRLAQPEDEALLDLKQVISQHIKRHQCTRAILVGHNAAFDLEFLNAAFKRHNLESPFHSFSTFDTVTLAGMAYGQTVLQQACEIADIEWDENKAHSAVYDCTQTAHLFCKIINEVKYVN